MNKLSSGIDYGKQRLYDVRAALISLARNSLFSALIPGIPLVLNDSQRKTVLFNGKLSLICSLTDN